MKTHVQNMMSICRKIKPWPGTNAGREAKIPMTKMIRRWQLNGSGGLESAAKNDSKKITALLMKNFSIAGKVGQAIQSNQRIRISSMLRC